MARRLIIEYVIVEGMESEADRIRADFLESVATWRPEAFSYEIFRKGADGNAFVHLVTLDTPETQQALGEQEFFRTFAEGMQRISGGTVTATPLLPWSPD